MYKIIRNSHMPRVIKWLFYIVLTVTLIYWLGILIYKILEYTRRFLHWASDKRNWWTFLVCILILLIGSLLIAQFALKLNPIGDFTEWIKNQWQSFRAYIGNLIGGA